MIQQLQMIWKLQKQIWHQRGRYAQHKVSRCGFDDQIKW
jgi:hypothetical protein